MDKRQHSFFSHWRTSLISSCTNATFHLVIESHGLFDSTPINSVWSSEAIRRHISEWTLAVVIPCCLTVPSHYLTNIDLLSVGFIDIHQRVISKQIRQSLSITLFKSYTPLCLSSSGTMSIWYVFHYVWCPLCTALRTIWLPNHNYKFYVDSMEKSYIVLTQLTASLSKGCFYQHHMMRGHQNENFRILF